MDTLGLKMKRRIATTARIPVAPALLSETKFDFQRNTAKCKSAITFQMSSSQILIGSRCHTSLRGNSTLREKGAKSVPLQGKDKNKQITGTFAVSLTGELLPV